VLESVSASVRHQSFRDIERRNLGEALARFIDDVIAATHDDGTGIWRIVGPWGARPVVGSDSLQVG
jgi:hypothetical protein